MARAIEQLKQAMEVCELGALTWPNQVDVLMDAARAILQEISTLTPPNEPLTLEQLREMDGKPVWIENLEEPEKSQWRLCHWDRRKYLVLQGISIGGYLVEEYGEAWIAYAYHPVHIDRKKWEPCKKCSGEYQQKIIALVERYHGCITETSNIDVNFCPVCGRPITDEAWDELEKRMRGM